ncbi:MAG: hypothetical protein J6V24_07695 [Clostridia bacterium]|nr:hypothetical protein [Clostridia bacterium]MBO7404831.1 hypothetical protein [Clostridia bacterium]
MKTTEYRIPANAADREKMEEQLRRQARLMNLLWSVSLIVIGVGTFVISAASIAGFDLPDILVRILGIADLIALPVLVFATVKKMRLRTAQLQTPAAVPHAEEKDGKTE